MINPRCTGKRRTLNARLTWGKKRVTVTDWFNSILFGRFKHGHQEYRYIRHKLIHIVPRTSSPLSSSFKQQNGENNTFLISSKVDEPLHEPVRSCMANATIHPCSSETFTHFHCILSFTSTARTSCTSHNVNEFSTNHLSRRRSRCDA